MPSAPSNFEVVSRASDLPIAAWQALQRVPTSANLILPILNKCVELDMAGRSPPGHLWIVIYSGPGRVALVLSCTDGYTGAYPIFIVDTQAIDDTQLTSFVHLSVLTLQRHIPIERVYSVFAPIRIAQLFSRMWTQLTGVQAEAQPYYDAKISCLQWHDNLQQSATSSENGIIFEVGLATYVDIHPVARLFHAFASDSPPFTLTTDEALAEANKLVSSRQVWVHKVNGKVVSVAAFTRNTRQVATITKVYTDPSCRGRGCAARLVRQLCVSLLQDKGRQAVVLFVGCQNSAARVYHQIGFQGLGNLGNGSAVDNSNRWLEVGFDRNKVTLGHW